MTIKERTSALLAAIQAKKDPLETERCAYWAELRDMTINGAPFVKEQELRAKIKLVQAKVLPLDALMCEAARVKTINDSGIAEMTLGAIEARL